MKKDCLVEFSAGVNLKFFAYFICILGTCQISAKILEIVEVKQDNYN